MNLCSRRISISFWASLLATCACFCMSMFVRVLSLRSGVIYTICDPDTPVMSCFQVSVRLRVCSSRALSSLRALFHVGDWCSDPGTHVVSFGIVSVFGHSRSMFWLIVWACRLEFARPCVLLSTCLVVCSQFLFLSAACIHVMSWAVWHAACVFHWLRAFMWPCLVWTRGLWLFSLAVCSCFAHGWWFVLLAMCLCFCFEWAHCFCLSFLCAMCSHVNCLDPTHLVTWSLVNLPHLPSLVTLLICSLYNLLVLAVLCQFVIDITLVFTFTAFSVICVLHSQVKSPLFI